jgi:hypothetical protein
MRMDVTFTKLAGRRYTVEVKRGVGPELATRSGPGYDSYLPHDVVHFIVEAEAGIHGGVFGRLAAGGCGIFWPADPRERRKHQRRKVVPTPEQRADMERSERLAALCPLLWELRAGLRNGLPESFSNVDHDELNSPLMDQICGRLGGVADRWYALQPGRSITMTWPHAEGRRPVRRSSVSEWRGRAPRVRRSSRRR